MKKLLFVCIENSNRSQMAQAFATMYGNGNIQAFSAGSRPGGAFAIDSRRCYQLAIY